MNLFTSCYAVCCFLLLLSTIAPSNRFKNATLPDWLSLKHLGSQHGSMGAVSSGLTDGFRGNCCVQRRPPVRCFNPHLNLQLLKLEHSGARIEEVWLVRNENGAQPLSPNLSREPMENRLAIVYNLSEAGDAEGSILKPLRLDWHPDGLAFMCLISTSNTLLCLAFQPQKIGWCFHGFPCSSFQQKSRWGKVGCPRTVSAWKCHRSLYPWKCWCSICRASKRLSAI